MTKKEKQEMLSTVKDAQKKLKNVEHQLLIATAANSVVNSKLEERNNAVYKLRSELNLTYAGIASALDISVSQVAESMKVLRDRGLFESRKKSATLIDDYIDEVKKLKKKKMTNKAISQKLGISNQTVVRCLERTANS